MELEIRSRILGGPVRLIAARSGVSGDSAPLVWLLHGRGASYDDIGQIVDRLDTAMTAGTLAPRTIVAPWAPWLDGASWWVDSAPPYGEPVESAILQDVLPEVERRWEMALGVADRVVAGYSMGGAAALRMLLVHPELFAAAALVAPAAYAVSPPLESSARTSGAFGAGAETFDEPTWRRLMSYTHLADPGPPSPVGPEISIVVGDEEEVQSYATGPSSLTLESAKLHTWLRAREGARSSLRVVAGGHTEEFWAPALGLALGLLDDGWGRSNQATST